MGCRGWLGGIQRGPSLCQRQGVWIPEPTSRIWCLKLKNCRFRQSTAQIRRKAFSHTQLVILSPSNLTEWAVYASHIRVRAEMLFAVRTINDAAAILGFVQKHVNGKLIVVVLFVGDVSTTRALGVWRWHTEVGS